MTDKADRADLESLMLDTMDAVSRYRVGQRDSIAAALDAGQLLNAAKDLVRHGEWAGYLKRVGLVERTAQTWMRVAKQGLTVEEIIEAGGIQSAARGGRRKSASDAALPNDVREAREAVDGMTATVGRRWNELNRDLEERRRLLKQLARLEQQAD